MSRQLVQPGSNFDAESRNYLINLVRDLELRFIGLESKRPPELGVYDYNDLLTATTPISVTGGAGWVKLTNDGLGPNSTSEFQLEGGEPLWVGDSINQFDFSSLTLGSAVDIRVDLQITTTVPNTDVSVRLFLGVGDPNTYTLPVVSDHSYKLAGTYTLTETQGLYIGNSLTRDNPGELMIMADHTLTVRVNGWFLKVIKK